VDRRRSGQEGARPRPHPGARVHRQAGQRQERSVAHRRRGRLLGAREQDLRVQGQGRHAGRRRLREPVPSAFGGRGLGPRLVPGVERRFDLRHGRRSRRRADHDGKPLRAGPLQGRLRPGRCLVPAVQGQGHQRLRRRLHGQEQGNAERLPALRAGRRSRLLPAQPPDAEGNEGRPRPDLHGHRHRPGQAGRDPDAEGSEAPRSRSLGRLPRHVHRPVRHLGRRERRSAREELRADADRALPARFALRLLRHLGFGPDRRRRADHGRVRRRSRAPAEGLELGLPLDDHGQGPVHRRRRRGRLGPQVLLRFAHRRPPGRQVDGQVRLDNADYKPEFDDRPTNRSPKRSGGRSRPS
jgi:hypothetical protein